MDEGATLVEELQNLMLHIYDARNPDHKNLQAPDGLLPAAGSVIPPDGVARRREA
jgi:hypothetical protein